MIVFKTEVIKFNATDAIADVLKVSGEKEILKLPIYENDKFVGLVTS